MTRNLPHAPRQTGSMLLEALIAMLVFSMGVLAIVGMQAVAVRVSSDAKYRSDAGLLANQLIGSMMVSTRTPATLNTNFSSPNGASYLTWRTEVQNTLPGVSANPPVVSIADISAGPTTSQVTQVTITIFWLSPSEPVGTAAHQYVTVSEIGCAVDTVSLQCT